MTALPNIELSYGTDMTTSYRVKRVDFGDGYAQRARDGLNTVRQRWKLVWERVSNTEAETLRNFFNGLAGVGIIEWTPYNQSTELKWTASDLSSKPVGPTTTTISVTLTQEFDL